MKVKGILLQKGLPKLYQYLVLALFFVILCYLAFLSAYSTCGVYASETSYFVRDSILLNLAVVAAVILLGVGLRLFRPFACFLEQLEKETSRYLRLRRILLAVLAGLALLWVLATQFAPRADQEDVLQAAYGIQLGDFSSFSDDGYLGMRHHQLGVTWVMYLFTLVFGGGNAVAFQVLNVAGLVLFYRELSEICLQCGFRRSVSLATVFTGILFYPLIFYCTFVYGNIWGLALSVLAIRLELAFLQTHQLRFCFTSAFAVTGAIFVKFNYVVFLIGMLLYALVEAAKQKKGKFLLLPLLMAVGVGLQSILPLAVARQVSGDPMDRGASTMAWVAMGLQQDGPVFPGWGGTVFPGWYNAYEYYTYQQSGHDGAIQQEMAKESIAQSLSYFASHPGETVKFFTRKTASQWNNPTFQCYWITENTDSQVGMSQWVWWLSRGPGAQLGAQYLNLLQFVLLAGAIFYCLLYRKDTKQQPFLLLAMIFIGGFLFQLIWEAKAQYTISYFVLLVPFALAGYARLTSRTLLLLSPKGRIQLTHRLQTQWKSLLPYGILSVCLAVVCVFAYAGPRGDYLVADTQGYLTYAREHSGAVTLSDGTWRLQNAGGLFLAVEERESPEKDTRPEGRFYLSDQAQGAETLLTVKNYQGKGWIYGEDPSCRFSIASEQGDEQQECSVDYYDYGNRVWRVLENEDGSYRFCYDEIYVLTADAQTQEVFLSVWQNLDTQKWIAVSP